MARRLVRKAKVLKPIKRLQAGSLRLTRESKFSCKGISKRAVLTPLKTFRNVLKTTKYVSAVNKGQWNIIMDNGIGTSVLDITRSPE